MKKTAEHMDIRTNVITRQCNQETVFSLDVSYCNHC
jgi:hypothetical protein